MTDGSTTTVATLGKENGFFGNLKVKILLPPTLKKSKARCGKLAAKHLD